MARAIKRVPLDFSYPIDKLWVGYDNPYHVSCDFCDGGYTLDYIQIKNYIYGYPPKFSDFNSELVDKILQGIKELNDFETKEEMLEHLNSQLSSRYTCKHCDGEGVNKYLFDKFNTWESFDPPEGEGYQLWSTTTVGSPKSPVFKSMENLIDWCTENSTIYGQTKSPKESWEKYLLTNEPFKLYGDT